MEITSEDERSLARLMSQPAVGVGIVRQSKANVTDVVRRVKEQMERIRLTLPKEVRVEFPYDEAIFVERAINEVWITLFIAFGFVIMRIFVFLRDLRSTLIPSITIPVVITGVVFVMYWLGYSINILAMFALVLARGGAVDDSIVVLENIYRHTEEGMPPLKAAFRGMREIGFAVIVTTVALVAVFLPLAFETTFTGRVFVEFAFVLCGAVSLSTFVAMTLTAILCPRIRRRVPATRHGSACHFFERAFDRVQRHYER